MTTVSQEAREAEVTITQADRDAVYAFHRDSFRALFETTDEGSEDQLNRAHKLLCQAFARHRQSAERGEVVAWMYERKGFAPAVSMRDPRLRYSDIETLHPLYTLPAAPEAA